MRALFARTRRVSAPKTTERSRRRRRDAHGSPASDFSPTYAYKSNCRSDRHRSPIATLVGDRTRRLCVLPIFLLDYYFTGPKFLKSFEMVSKFAVLALAVVAFAVSEIESRAVPAVPAVEPMPLMLDVIGSPLLFNRDKRGAYRSYPQRTMMFTGFYRPTRHSEDSNGDQASGVYAQGGSVGGGTYFGRQPQYLRDDGPQPVDEPEIASADAEASPAAPEDAGIDEQQAQEHEGAQENPDNEAENPIFHDSPKPEEPPTHKQPSKVGTKKGKKMPIPAEDEDEEYEEDEDEAPVSPFRPGKGKPNKHYPSLNNFFPMVFSFPRGSGARRGSSSSSTDSIPGMITAIANSYSTGKGGVASSIATAYGGSPMKKQRRPSHSTAH